jgi:branched-chain amino acid transport system permease protein
VKGIRSWLPRCAIAICLVAAVAFPVVTRDAYLLYLLTLVFVYGIAAIGLNLLSGYAGQISLAQAAFMAIGAYSVAIVSKKLTGWQLFAASGSSVWFALVVAVLLTAAAGGILAFPTLRARGPYLAMMTLAFSWITWKVLLEWVALTGGDLGIAAIPRLQFARWPLTDAMVYAVVFICFVLTWLFSRRIVRSPFGLQMRAIRYSDLVPQSSGVDVRAVRVAVFIVSSACAGLAGGLFASHQSYINPDAFHVFDSISILLAVLLGGPGTLVGPIVGTTILTLLPEMLHDFDRYRLIVYGLTVLVGLYWMPQGVVGTLRTRRRRENKEVRIAEGQASRDTRLPASLRTDSGSSLVINDLSIAFGGVRALHGVSLTVEPGTVHAVIGPNGAGKTTLINVVTGVVRPDNGHIALDGTPTAWQPLHDAARRGVVRTFQNIVLLGDLTVLEHVLLGIVGGQGLQFRRSLFARSATADRQNRAAALELLGFVGLSNWADVPAHALPQGYRRLMELARALAVRPRILLLDEPAAGLVASEVSSLGRILRRLREYHVSILLVEHNVDFVLSLADKVTVLDHGVVIASGPPEVVVKDQQVIASYLGPQNAAT